jgi:hypothetical protein
MYKLGSRLIRVTLGAAIVVGLGAAASAQKFEVKSIVIDRPWARATPGGAKVAGGYMIITNTGNEPDRLIGGALPQAGRFEVHEMRMQNNVMQMREVPGGLEIKPGEKVELKPGGYHVMFMDLREPLKQGDKLKGQLRFQKAGTVDIEYRVEAIGAQSAPRHGH